jgi:hypothetical protein
VTINGKPYIYSSRDRTVRFAYFSTTRIYYRSQTERCQNNCKFAFVWQMERLNCTKQAEAGVNTWNASRTVNTTCSAPELNQRRYWHRSCWQRVTQYCSWKMMCTVWTVCSVDRTCFRVVYPCKLLWSPIPLFLLLTDIECTDSSRALYHSWIVNKRMEVIF